MADVVIDLIDPKDLTTVVHLYNQVFRPERDADFFQRRLEGRHNVLVMAARIGRDAVGFYIGMERTPSVFFGWLVGILPDARRMGVASQLMNAASDWARTRGYDAMRFECNNRNRALLHFGIANDYDIVGIRWDHDRNENMIVFEKRLVD